MDEPTVDIWPILQRLGITIAKRADGWGYHVALKGGKAISGSGHDTAAEALEEALSLLIARVT